MAGCRFRTWLSAGFTDEAWQMLAYRGMTFNVQYGEFRHGFQKDDKDTRLVFYGLRHILEHHIKRRWTQKDVDQADRFFK